MTETAWRERGRQVLARPWPPMLRDAPELRDGAAPWFFTGACGARLVDEDGRDYLDLEMGRGPNLLGYGHPVTRAAIAEHARLAVQTSLLHRAEVEVAELLVELVPCAERVVFAKNGSDACTAAVRVARAATGRDVILSSGYHGYHDWFMAETGWAEGFPAAYRGFVHGFELNDLAAVEELAERHAGQVAAIIVEPAHRLLPAPGFLAALRRIADRAGAVLIFDEVVTAFRLHLGGAQGYSGVVPDLACLGKAMSNGYPLSALVGRREVMENLQKTFFSMTYQHDSLGFAIARACLRHLRDSAAIETVAAHGEAIRSAFDGAAARHGLPARARGFSARLDFDFPDLPGLPPDAQLALFRRTLLDHGLLPVRAAFACEALTAADLAQAAAAFDAAFARLEKGS
jgi:glutamate-1-semialdehyde 2,1-aminomutase